VGRIYYGWCVVAMAMAVFALLIGFSFAAFGLFVLPVSKEFGLSRADMNTALILLNLGMAVVAPVIGRMLDRFPLKRIMLVSALILGASLITLGLSRSLWLSAFVMALPLAMALNGGGFLTMTVLIARWFQAQRGRALALAAIGMSLGGMLGPVAIGFLIHVEGWRFALILCGAVASVVLLGLSLILRDHPRPGEADREASAPAREARPTAAPGAPARMGDLLRAPQFWTIGLGSALAFSVTTAVLISLAPLAMGAGFSTVKVTSLLSASAGAAMVGKMVLAVFADRVDRVALMTGICVLVALANAALFASESYGALLATTVGLGLAMGALAPAMQTLVAERFGQASFGTVQGLMAPIIAITSAMAVRFAGEVFDRTDGYDLMFTAFIGVMLAAAALLFATRLFQHPQAASLGAAQA
jgi:predicted MFS family arabinose efflux permease